MNKNTFISGQCEITINNSRKDTIKNELTEGTLLNSVQNFRTIYNSVNDAIFIHDIDGNILDVNDKMLEMFAVRREEVKKLSIINDTSHSSNPTEILPEIWEEVVAGENQSFEWKGRPAS